VIEGAALPSQCRYWTLDIIDRSTAPEMDEGTRASAPLAGGVGIGGGPPTQIIQSGSQAILASSKG